MLEFVWLTVTLRQAAALCYRRTGVSWFQFVRTHTIAWDFASREKRATLADHTKAITALAFFS